MKGLRVWVLLEEFDRGGRRRRHSAESTQRGQNEQLLGWLLGGLVERPFDSPLGLFKLFEMINVLNLPL